MNGLMLHCGNRTVTRDQVNECQTPLQTDTWTPIPHIVLVNEVEKQMKAAGLVISDQVHSLNLDKDGDKRGSRYFGLMEIESPNDDDYRVIAGLRNSHDRMFAASICIGNRVFICDNLSFFNEVVFGRKHTPNILRDIPELVSRAVGQLNTIRDNQDDRIQAYKSHEISDETAHHLFVNVIKSRVVSPSKIKNMYEEWENPSHDVFKDRNVWSAFNAVTEVMKPKSAARANVWENPRRTQALFGVCDVISGLQVSTQKIYPSAKNPEKN